MWELCPTVVIIVRFEWDPGKILTFKEKTYSDDDGAVHLTEQLPPYLMWKTNECHFHSVKSSTLSLLRLLLWRPMKPWCVTHPWCSWSCKLWLNHRVILFFSCQTVHNGVSDLTLDGFISLDWTKPFVSHWNWFTSNRFIIAIKAQRGSSLMILFSTRSCLFWYWFEEGTRLVWADVVSEFSQIILSLYYSSIGQFAVVLGHISRAFLSVTCQFVHCCLFFCPVTSWWRWWRCQTAANRRRSEATKHPSSASHLTPKTITWWVIFSPKASGLSFFKNVPDLTFPLEQCFPTTVAAHRCAMRNH